MIASPMRTNTIPRIRLNHQRSSDMLRNFATIDRPPIVMSTSMTESPSVYTSVYPIPARSDTGNTVARRRVYVGEQVEKTGPSATPVAIALTRGDPIS